MARATVMGRVTWQDRELRTNLARTDARVTAAMTAAVGYIAPQAEAWARANATWTDRTGNARGGLTARPQVVSAGRGAVARVVVSHSVPYGIWLEVRWGGRYKVIMPTVEHFGPLAMGLIGRMMRRS